MPLVPSAPRLRGDFWLTACVNYPPYARYGSFAMDEACICYAPAKKHTALGMTMRLVLMAASAALAVSPVFAHAETGGSYARQAASSVVRLFVPDTDNSGHVASGSGFVISGEYIATALHVVNGVGAGDIKVMREGMTTPLIGEVVATEPRRDLAIVRVSGLHATALPLYAGVSDADQGEQAFVDGFPGESDRYEAKFALAPSTETVNIQRIVHGSYEGGAGAPFSIVEFGPNLGGGFSGAPLLDACGRVIGVASKSALTGALTLDGVQRVASDQPTSRATDAGELVELARRSNLDISVQSNACDSANGASTPAAAAAANATAIPGAGASASAQASAGAASAAGKGQFDPKLIGGGIVAAGLAIAGVFMLSRRRAAPPPPAPVPVKGDKGIGFGAGTGTAVVPTRPSKTTVIGTSLELTGRSANAYGTKIVMTPEEFRADRNMIDLYRDQPGPGRKLLSQGPISNPHARFTYEPGAEEKIYVQDLEATNGTTVNGQPLGTERVRLKTGDLIAFARTFEFEVVLRDGF
jgi:hypothetical protein